MPGLPPRNLLPSVRAKSASGDAGSSEDSSDSESDSPDGSGNEGISFRSPVQTVLARQKSMVSPIPLLAASPSLARLLHQPSARVRVPGGPAASVSVKKIKANVSLLPQADLPVGERGAFEMRMEEG